MSYVYFMKPSDHDGPIKIGVSVIPKNRLPVLAIWSPLPLCIVATAPGTKAAARALHVRFKACRSRSEWFTATPELQAYVAKVKETGLLHDLSPVLFEELPGSLTHSNPFRNLRAIARRHAIALRDLSAISGIGISSLAASPSGAHVPLDTVRSVLYGLEQLGVSVTWRDLCARKEAA